MPTINIEDVKDYEYKAAWHAMRSGLAANHAKYLAYLEEQNAKAQTE